MIFLWIMITTSDLPEDFFWQEPAIPVLVRIRISHLFSAGLIIRWIAIMQLGKSFTVDVAISLVRQP